MTCVGQMQTNILTALWQAQVPHSCVCNSKHDAQERGWAMRVECHLLVFVCFVTRTQHNNNTSVSLQMLTCMYINTNRHICMHENLGPRLHNHTNHLIWADAIKLTILWQLGVLCTCAANCFLVAHTQNIKTNDFLQMLTHESTSSPPPAACSGCLLLTEGVFPDGYGTDHIHSPPVMLRYGACQVFGRFWGPNGARGAVWEVFWAEARICDFWPDWLFFAFFCAKNNEKKVTTLPPSPLMCL